MAHPLRRAGTYVGLVIACVAWCVSCGSPAAPSPPTTEPDNGTLTSSTNFGIFTFTTSSGGDITITLVSLSQAVPVEVSIGTVSGGGCTIQAVQPSFVIGEQWQNSLSVAGTYCVEIDDISTPNPPASLTYSLSVTHPS